MYYLYIIKCADKTLYTGITTDLKRRIIEHNSTKLGAKYTSSRRPVKLVFSKNSKIDLPRLKKNLELKS